MVRDTVLVVDDDSNSLSIVSRYLSKYGYQTIIANSGSLALRKFNDDGSKIGLIITDMQMPMMSGEEFIKKINEIDSKVPIIIFSGTGLDYNHLKEISNVKEVLEKPINYNQFQVIAKKNFLED